MASNLLTPAQIAEIRERANEQIREGGSEAGEAFAGDVLDLLAALDAATAEVERMRKALGVIAKYDSDRRPGCEHCCSNIARTALEGKKT